MTQVSNIRPVSLAPSIKATVPQALNEVLGPVDYVDGYNADATVLCLDEFRGSLPPGRHHHGDLVFSVLESAGLKDSEIQKVHHKNLSRAANELLYPGPESPKERLQTFIELTAIEDIESTRHIIQQATSKPANQIKTVTNSLGTTPVRVANGIFFGSIEFDQGQPKKLTEIGEFAFEALDVQPELSPQNIKKFRENLLATTVQLYKESESVVQSRAQFNTELDELAEKGVSYFLSAGNDQMRVENLRKAGLAVSPFAAFISKSVPNAEIVAALDTKGTKDPSDDEIAPFSSDDPKVSYAAKGIDVEVDTPDGKLFLQGSSLAAPWVAAKRELHRQNNPSMSAAELEASFREESAWSLQDRIAVID